MSKVISYKLNKFRREKDLAGKSEYGSKRCLLRVLMIGVYRDKQCLFTTLMIYPHSRKLCLFQPSKIYC